MLYHFVAYATIFVILFGGEPAQGIFTLFDYVCWVTLTQPLQEKASLRKLGGLHQSHGKMFYRYLVQRRLHFI